VVAVALATLAAGCGDDGGGERVTVSEEEYEAEVERLCNQHGAVLAEAYGEVVPDSDAAEVDYYRTDYIPRAKALISRLAEFGFPAEHDAEYREVLTEALEALNDLEADPFRYLDRRHRGVIDPDADFLTVVRRSFEAAGIPC
jgi:hypothetical protein